MLTRTTSPRRANANALANDERRGMTRAKSRHVRDLLRATSYVTDEGEILARELPRQSLLSRMRTSRGRSEVEANEASNQFVVETLRGLYRRLPEKASFVMRQRRAGTMTELWEGHALPTRDEDVLRRQEHLQLGVSEMNGVRRGGRGGLGMVREAFVQEFRDLYEIVGSMEARKWDICQGDVRALFEWFKMMENFLRLYVTLSQREYVVAGHAEWGIQEKRKVVKAAERVEEMKRVMIALNGGCGKMMERLRTRVEEFVEKVTDFLEQEKRMVGRALEDQFDDLVRRMSEEDNGNEAVVILGRGSADVDWGKRIGGWRAVRRVKERHWEYVGLFVCAEREYQRMYGKTRAQQGQRRCSDAIDEDMI